MRTSFLQALKIKLALDIINEVHSRCPEISLVMHGSSSVPAHMVEEVNKYGGKVPNAVGVPTDMIQDAIGRGMRKINIDTDGRLAITAAIRKVFVEKPAAFDPRQYLGSGKRCCAYVDYRRNEEAFGTAGHAEDL